MVDVNDPGLGLGGSGGDQIWALVGEHGFELEAKQLGQGHVRDEKSFAGRRQSRPSSEIPTTMTRK